MYTTVQQYLSQYKIINLSKKNKSCGTKNEKKNITTVQQCASQYRNVNFSTKIKVSVQKNIFKKNLEKISRYFIYDYYYVPKYMLIILYLNKTYIFHYYKFSRLYRAKHHLTALYYGGPQRQYTNIYYITALYILVHKHIHRLCV